MERYPQADCEFSKSHRYKGLVFRRKNKTKLWKVEDESHGPQIVLNRIIK